MFELSLPKLLIVVVIVVLIFGTKRLRTLGSDLGTSLRGFKKAMSDNNDDSNDSDSNFTQNRSNNGEKRVIGTDDRNIDRESTKTSVDDNDK